MSSEAGQVQGVQPLRSVQTPSFNPPPRRGGGHRWGLELLERFERFEQDAMVEVIT